MSIECWGWYSIAVNVVLAGINLAVALASGSLAVEAEGRGDRVTRGQGNRVTGAAMVSERRLHRHWPGVSIGYAHNTPRLVYGTGRGGVYVAAGALTD